MSRAERTAAIERLQSERGDTTVVSYITSTRTGLDTMMAMDVIPVIYRHCRAIPTPPKDTKIDLFIHSDGGEGIVPWRLVTLLREFCAELVVLVPNRAFSAATLTALGADEVIMHPMGMLGPIDPTVANEFNPANPRNPQQVLGISVEDVASYIALVKEDVGIRHEDELVQAFLRLAEGVHPLALGNVKRSTSQSRMMGEKLLKSRQKEHLVEHAVSEVIQKLTSELYYHGHPINRSEARDDLGLDFVRNAEPSVEAAMWNLYSLYDDAMLLSQAFQPVQEALAKNPLPVAPHPDPQASPVASVPLDTLRTVYVESLAGCDVFESEYEATLRRDYVGTYSAQINLMRQGWTTET